MTDNHKLKFESEEFQDYDMGTPMEYKMPSALNLESMGDNLQKWKNFKQQLEIFITAAGLDRASETRKSAILLNFIGKEGQDIYFNILKQNQENLKYEELVRKFDEYFEPQHNELVSSFKFNKKVQEDGETWDNFYSEIKRLAKICNFGEMENRMLRDKIVMGIRDIKVQRRLLESSSLTLEQAVAVCRAAEISKEHVQILQKNEALQEVDVINKQLVSSAKNKAKYSRNSSYNNKFYRCKKCNREHGPAQCPAYGKTCTLCHKTNHFAVGCRNKFRNSVQEIKESQDHCEVQDL